MVTWIERRDHHPDALRPRSKRSRALGSELWERSRCSACRFDQRNRRNAEPVEPYCVFPWHCCGRACKATVGRNPDVHGRVPHRHRSRNRLGWKIAQWARPGHCRPVFPTWCPWSQSPQSGRHFLGNRCGDCLWHGPSRNDARLPLGPRPAA